MLYYTADAIYTGNDLLTDTLVVVDENGVVHDLLPNTEIDALKVQSFRGAICPGLVNTHCHLELSYLYNKIEQGKGLSQFIKDLEIHKSSDEEFIQTCIQKADEEMLHNGIVAVGDISNNSSTFGQKQRSKILYHNFIELYAFLPERAAKAFEHGLALYHEAPFPKSIVPHAPYSISVELMKLIDEFSRQNNNILSIHNQESHAENEMFLHKSGEIVERFKLWGFDIDFWNPIQKNPLYYVMEHLNAQEKLLLVHNTCSNINDIEYAKSTNKNVYWCICANANIYIENKLPKLPMFMQEGCKITIGTDSLASNWSLNLLDEWRCIQSRYPEIGIQQLIQWSSINGAEFLGLDASIGSIQKGKKPGLNLLENIEEGRVNNNSTIKKII
jgi:cytosine/adenosine deaminase-related metal-dependent hydrolase